MGLVDGNVHSPDVYAGRQSPKSGAFAGDPEGRVRRPGSEFERAVEHDRHHVA